MGKLRTLTRRSFLVGTTAIAGGVAFGIYAYNTPGRNPLKPQLAEGEAAITNYVRITPEGITLITPRADLGQGAYHIQAALIAEELDVDLDQISVDPGPPSAVYYNTALSAEAAPFPATNHSGVAETVRTVMDAPMKFIGLQITGGSTTVPDQYEKLRIAGAVARETLKKCASERTGIAADRMKTANGKIELPDGQTIAYTDLAGEAARTDPVSSVSLRPESEWRYLGKDMQRIDIIGKSTGTQAYGIDAAVEGMVHATIVTNPRFGGEMLTYDASAAEKMRGVQKILPVTGGVGVVADNTWRAFEAARAIRFEWGEAPYPAEMDAHWKTLENSFIEERLDSRNLDKGDVAGVLAGAGVIEAEYRAPYLSHAPLEPVSAIVKVTDERVDIWTGTQVPRFVQTNAARITGHNAENVHVHVLMMGGSFGHRLEDDYVQRTVELANQMRGTPVKMTYSREEDMAHDFPRQIAMARGKGSVKDGKVEAYDLAIAMPSVFSSQMGRQGLSIPGPDAIIFAAAWDQPYDIAHYRMSAYRAPDLAPMSSWRSVGASTNAFFHEGILDEIILAAGADPLEERIRLMWHEPSRKTLEAVGEMSNWGTDPGSNRGRGVAFSMSFGVPTAEVIEVTNTPDGIRIDKVYVAAEVGAVLDPVNFENQVQGGVVWALGHAMNCETTFSDGMVEQLNYHAFEGMRLYQCPAIEVRGLENGDKVRGIGEPPVPPAAPALANAIFAATGKRIREMPFNKHIDFV